MKNKGFYGLFIIGVMAGIVSGKWGLLGGVALVLAGFTSLALIYKPERGLYLLAGYSMLDYFFTKYGGFVGGLWDELLLILLIGVFLINSVMKNKGFKYRFTNLDIPILTFFSITIFLVLANSPSLSIAIEGARVMLQYILWFFVAVNLLKDRIVIRRVILVLIFIAAFMSLHGIYQYIIGVELPTTWYDSNYEVIRTRVFSIIGSPNILGSFLVLIIPVTFAFLLNEKKTLKKLFFTVSTAIMLLCLVFTLSRGAWLAFGLAVIVYAFMKDRRLIFPVVITGIILVAAVPQIGDRFAYMLSPQYLASSAKGGRVVRWTMAIEVFKESPLFGVGLGRYGGAVAMRNIPGSFYADNFYIKVLAEMGIIGIVGFLFMLYRGSVESIKTLFIVKDKELSNIALGVFAGMIGVLAHNAVENVFEVPMMVTYFWLLAAIITAIKIIDDQSNVEVNQDNE